jgi:hypothetical protein
VSDASHEINHSCGRIHRGRGAIRCFRGLDVSAASPLDGFAEHLRFNFPQILPIACSRLPKQEFTPEETWH